MTMPSVKINGASRVLIVLVACALSIAACETYYFRANYRDVNQLLHLDHGPRAKLYLKAHLKNGDVCILRDSWEIDTSRSVLSGTGTRFDMHRLLLHEGAMTIAIDSIAIIETNRKLLGTESDRVTALSIVAGVDLVVAIACLSNPKACFGSCPTFYMNENDNIHFADAEGFTHAILPSMEYGDVDALHNDVITGSQFSLTMKNEARETHCVSDVLLLAYPREKGERVYHSRNDEYYLCGTQYALSAATGPEGDVSSKLKHRDRTERFSLADSSDLCSREAVYVNFDRVAEHENLGLVLTYRQTLMTTYLFYSAMGYMGDEVGDMFALLETRSETRKTFDTAARLLGEIEVFVWDENRDSWQRQGAIYESGPIASNLQILPLVTAPSNSRVRLKLVMNKGLWRIDHVALASIKAKVNPVRIQPTMVTSRGVVDDAALAALLAPDRHLISMPGSAYRITFPLPVGGRDYELFLYSKGYYLEWMREKWLQEKDLRKLAQMVASPRNYLREEAAAYKVYEETMEQLFWDSRIDTKALSYHEE
ncbi:MAG: hypothetical protein IH600_17500 [Bacteroidetes bacterium]|nr:hypothetical protein [Bacteroidota bacterium]